ncbi:hypothetical protein BDZ94DRAFT_1266533 [Collybia nuda]|uniref:MYND-type domain-containing protein n=1 Tax=Collybia nuda TaxID=64659 RepID=A0A9P5Y0S6_9AGAR|nr:hypothetical protein BDZ94DRAFT_1266533 [Collybia nuda]
MRESNFAFPTQNKACVCITSQLYDRRALDTTSALPLFNSLTHLTYLTSTSPRIREIMTMDGGLERLVRLLHDFCMCPPPPENATLLYGLTPPNSRPPRLTPTLNPTSFDKQAAYRFSLAFQCVVNIGVRGSEPIRSRVVQAGTLDVVGCILEAWLANKGFAVGPSSSATGIPRETREQRQARREAHIQQRNREQAAMLARELQRQVSIERQVRPEDISMDVSPSPSTTISAGASTTNSDTEMSTDASTAATPVESGTPTGSVVIPSRDRSGTIIARPVWDPAPAPDPEAHHHPSPPPSTDTSRPDTETEDDGDIDMDRSRHTSNSPSPERHPQPHTHGRLSLSRRAVGIVSDDPPTGEVGAMELGTDAHIIINEAGGVGDGAGVEDGIVSLEPNDDFAMGAPPGAPGAIDEGTTPRGLNLEPGRRRNTAAGEAPDVTPRAGVISLPMAGGATVGGPAGRNVPAGHHHHHRGNTTRTRTHTDVAGMDRPPRTSSNATHHARDVDIGPYRDEDVLLSLQLLAYLSKYPHVRQAFYKPRVTFHPASVDLPGARYGSGTGERAKEKERERERGVMSVGAAKEAAQGFLKAFGPGAGRAKEKEREREAKIGGAGQTNITVTPAVATSTPPRQTNVFSLVERFTFKPSSTEADLLNPPPRLPPEIQYWAGVIMRNACRKDDSRGGIRQCANMLCGKWEQFPREFAKCRRCRKAKYCGKECQSTAWSEGHRFWCSAKDGDDDVTGDAAAAVTQHHIQDGGDISIAADDSMEVIVPVSMTVGGTVVSRTDRRERERHQRDRERAAVAMQNRLPAQFRGNPGPGGMGSFGGTGGRVESGVLGRERLGGVHPPVIPSPVRPRVETRPRVAALHNVPPHGHYGNFESFPVDQGRRRAETVTGVVATSGPGIRPAPVHSLMHPNPHSRMQPQLQTSPGRVFIPGSGNSAVAGPSRRRRGDEGSRGDHDMVLG